MTKFKCGVCGHVVDNDKAHVCCGKPMKKTSDKDSSSCGCC